jgi:hypothetical protein
MLLIQQFRRIALVAIVGLSVAACGGGGGDSGSSVGAGTPPPTTNPPPPSGTLGSATISWTAPTQNTDGSALTDLAGYEIRFGQTASDLDSILTINGVGSQDRVIENLTKGTWYFSVAARNSQGLVSAHSDPVSKVIS